MSVSFVESIPVVDVIKHFCRNSGKSRFPSKPKQQELAILKATNSFGVLLCLKIALFYHFSARLDMRTNFFNFLIFQKKFYNIDY